MLASYIQALEMRAKWLRWSLEKGSQLLKLDRTILPLYRHALRDGDSLFMDHHFCDMVDHARVSLPDDIQFEVSWMQTKNGFLWLDYPFATPKPTGLEDMSDILGNKGGLIRAVGWNHIPEDDSYQFVTFMSFADYIPGSMGFGCWSYFAIRQGDTVISKLNEFEEKARFNYILAAAKGTPDDPDLAAGYYDRNREMELYHEIRWIYTAMYLMAQRLAHTSEHKTSGMARHSAARQKLQIAPLLKVVSLRRMQEERPVGTSEKDWHWQWAVRGHWRLQPYKTLDDYKWIFIESFMKGPPGKPVKPPSHTLFIARK